MRRFFDILKANIGLKILSVGVAIVIWYLVINVNDPVETASFNVRISVENESYISSGKQIYRIDDSYKTVTAYIRGNRSTLSRINSENILVRADLTQIVDMERDPIMVPLSASCTGVNAANITLSRTAIPITIENVASRQFPVSVDTGDTTPGNNYEVGVMTPNPEQVVINGPESIINTLDSVVARIDVTGMTQDGYKKAEVRLIDKSGREVSQETVEDDLSFEGGVSGVTVHVDLWRKQSDVSLEVNYSGEPAAGYHAMETATTPDTITVAGSDAALLALSEAGYTLTIPAEMISVEGATEDVVQTISLTDILPEEMRPASSTADTLTVRITILSDETREVTLDVDKLRTKGLASGLTVSYEQTSFTVRVKGLPSALEGIAEAELYALIDVSGKEAGDYTVPVEMTLPPGVSLDQEVTLPIHLKEKAKQGSGG